MAARNKGFFRRLLDRLKPRLKPEPPERPPPPEVPPNTPPRDGGTPGGGSLPEPHERKMRQAYKAVNEGTLTGYQDWRDLFEPLEVIFDGNAEKEKYWDMFLRAFKLTTHDPGHVRRQTFYTKTGIPRSQIDWSLWRDMHGYQSRK